MEFGPRFGAFDHRCGAVPAGVRPSRPVERFREKRVRDAQRYVPSFTHSLIHKFNDEQRLSRRFAPTLGHSRSRTHPGRDGLNQRVNGCELDHSGLRTDHAGDRRVRGAACDQRNVGHSRQRRLRMARPYRHRYSDRNPAGRLSEHSPPRRSSVAYFTNSTRRVLRVCWSGSCGFHRDAARQQQTSRLRRVRTRLLHSLDGQ